MSSQPDRQAILDLFAKIHLPSVASEPDLISILINLAELKPKRGLRSFYVNMKTINPDDQNLSAAAALNKFLNPEVHACAGPIFMRMKELTNSSQTERVRIEQVVDLLQVYAIEKDPKGIRPFTLIAAAGVFDYLAFIKSPNISYLAECILGRMKEDPGLVQAILSPGVSILRSDTTVLRQTLRDTILASHGGIEAWAKDSLDSKSRSDLYAFTGWREVLKSLTKTGRGKALEIDLGM